MTKDILLGILFLVLLPIACGPDIEKKELFKIDHVLIWVKDPMKMKSNIEALGFTAIPDSLSMVHKGQGTTGRYFYFLNCYLELIFVNDEEEFQKNIAVNPMLDLRERKNSIGNGFSPFGIGLKMKEYAPKTIPFEVFKYHQDWMGEGNNIYSATDSKRYKEEPSVFIVFPEIASDEFEDVDSLSKIPEEYSMWREFFKHKNGAQKITKLVYTLKGDVKQSKMLEELKQIDIVNFKIGEEHLLEIYFDNNQQGVKNDLRPDLPIIIYI